MVSIAVSALWSYIGGVRLFAALLLLTGPLFGQTDRTNINDGFDKPLKRTVVDLGPSPDNVPPSQSIRRRLTCYYYSTFTVKQYDEGQKGAEWLSIVHSGQASCTPKFGKDEKVYRYPEWSGYFWGVKGKIAFFEAPDGEDGGLPFAAFDVMTGRKLFEDSVLLDSNQKKLHIAQVFHISSQADQVPLLTYFRVVGAGCDLRKEQAGCWSKVRARLGIGQMQKPVCSGYAQQEEGSESAIAYPVSVLLKGSPQIKATDGPIFCWPVD